jgi:non-haem Fe2+, alpha-ketoglutarate-dependent halogenase
VEGLPLVSAARYAREGFVSPVRVLDPDEVDAANRSFERFMSRCVTPLSRLPFTHKYFRWAFELAAHPCLLNAVESILGPDILVWGTLILSKPPDCRSVVCWHQDNAYAGFLKGSPALSAWIALTPATAENGCMRVIPGSHGRLLPFIEVQDQNDMLKRGQRVAEEIDESAAVDLELLPGEASLHDIGLVHGSNANRSDGARTGFIVRYATPAMRQPEYPVYCVRGSAGDIRCEDEPPPVDSEESFQAFNEALAML